MWTPSVVSNHLAMDLSIRSLSKLIKIKELEIFKNVLI